MRTHANPNIIIFLIGNKVDLEGKRVIEYQRALKFSENEGFKLFLESSAKTGFNAQKVFIESAKILYIDYVKYKDRVDKSRSSSVHSSIIKKGSLNQSIKPTNITPDKKESKCSC